MTSPPADAVARLALSALVEPGLWSVHESVAAHGADAPEPIGAYIHSLKSAVLAARKEVA